MAGKSTNTAKDGVLIAVSVDLQAPTACFHTWLQGSLIGLRLEIGRGMKQRDLYVACGYSYLNLSGNQWPNDQAKIEHEKARKNF